MRNYLRPRISDRPLVTHVQSGRIHGGASIVARRICTALDTFQRFECRFVVISPVDKILESLWASLRYRVERKIFGWGYSETMIPTGHHPPIDPRATDLVHLHSPYDSGITIGEITRLGAAVPLIWTIHDARWVTTKTFKSIYGSSLPWSARVVELVRDIGSKILRARVRRAMSAALVVFPSAWLRNAAIEVGVVAATRSVVIPSPVPESHFNLSISKAAARKKYGLPAETPIVLFVAWKAWKSKGDMNKGYDLLETAIMQTRNHQDFHFVILGHDGEEIPAKLRAHWICPNGSDLQVAEIMRAADCTIGASRRENFPATIQESLAVGTPVIVSASTGYLELVEDGVTGLFFTPGSHTNLSEKISEMLKSRDERNVMAKNAARRARELWHPLISSGHYAEIYRQQLGFTDC